MIVSVTQCRVYKQSQNFAISSVCEPYYSQAKALRNQRTTVNGPQVYEQKLTITNCQEDRNKTQQDSALGLFNYY